MKRILILGAVAALLAASAGSAIANDARAIALGGSVIANGKGVHGAIGNPASMMAMQRRSETVHFRFGFGAEFRDSGDTLDTLTDSENEDLISDIEREIDVLSSAPITCNPIEGEFQSTGSDPCVSGTQSLSDLAGRVLDIIDLVDEESIEGLGVADVGMAFTHSTVPFAINLRFSAAGSGSPDISDGDRAYISEFSTLLDDDSITLDELNSSEFLSFNDVGEPLTVQQPEDVLQTRGSGGALLRTQLGVSLATTVIVGGHNVDLGVTPKFSSLRAQNLDIPVSDEFREEVPSASDQFKDSEVSESSFTIDIGGSMLLPDIPVRVAAVIRNLIPESIKTMDGFEFETTPQLILGAAFHRGLLSVTGDLALNEAEQDNFATQKLGVGVEYGTRLLAVRAGINHDAARTTETTALSLGFGLGPLDIGGRVTGVDALEMGAQIAFSFK
ncbi:MAG: conjugal transfer protein TraF [Granulosicoccus sp.]